MRGSAAAALRRDRRTPQGAVRRSRERAGSRHCAPRTRSERSAWPSARTRSARGARSDHRRGTRRARRSGCRPTSAAVSGRPASVRCRPGASGCASGAWRGPLAPRGGRPRRAGRPRPRPISPGCAPSRRASGSNSLNMASRISVSSSAPTLPRAASRSVSWVKPEMSIDCQSAVDDPMRRRGVLGQPGPQQLRHERREVGRVGARARHALPPLASAGCLGYPAIRSTEALSELRTKCLLHDSRRWRQSRHLLLRLTTPRTAVGPLGRAARRACRRSRSKRVEPILTTPC